MTLISSFAFLQTSHIGNTPIDAEKEREREVSEPECYTPYSFPPHIVSILIYNKFRTLRAALALDSSNSPRIIGNTSPTRTRPTHTLHTHAHPLHTHTHAHSYANVQRVCVCVWFLFRLLPNWARFCGLRTPVSRQRITCTLYYTYTVQQNTLKWFYGAI